MVGVEDLATTLEDDGRAVVEAKGAKLDTDPDNNSARDVFDVSYTDHVGTSPVYIHRVQDAVELKGQIVLPNIGQMVVTQDPGFVRDSVGFMASRHLEWTRQAFVIVHGQGWDDGV